MKRTEQLGPYSLTWDDGVFPLGSDALALGDFAPVRPGWRVCDLRTAPLPAGGFDLVVSNPPYFPVGSGKSAGPARSEESCTLEELCAAAGRLTKNGGRFALCHRPERLTDVLCALRAHNLEPKRLRLVSHRPGYPPSLLLVEAVRQGKPGITVET